MSIYLGCNMKMQNVRYIVNKCVTKVNSGNKLVYYCMCCLFAVQRMYVKFHKKGARK